jgi:CheY-like chemotaxis protein
VRVVTDESISKFSRAAILWVDDEPQNNQYLMRAFQALGILVDLVPSTDAAVSFVLEHNYDVIITDMGRPTDMRAGYTLLTELRAQGIRTPVLIYSSSDSEEYRQEALAAGAIDSTDSSQRVFDLVTTIISSKLDN